MSYDESRSGFTVDADARIETNNYLLLGDNAYGFTYAASNPSSGIFGDFDTYRLIVDVGSSYSILTTGVTSFGVSVNNSNFILADRTGSAIALSTDLGPYSSLTFTATDSIYYVSVFSDSIGFYGLSADNKSVRETVGVGETITRGQSYLASLDYASDVDKYYFTATAGVSYTFALGSTIPDLFIDIEYDDLHIDNLVTNGLGLYSFTAPVDGLYKVNISSNSFTNTGIYGFVTDLRSELNNAPTGGVSISGTARQGQVLTASHTLSDIDGLGTITYEWHSNGNYISGAVGSTYTLKQADVGKVITVVASYTDQLGSPEIVASGATASVVGSDIVAPLVSTFSPTDGATGVAVGNNIVLTFNEAIQKGTGTIFLRSGSATGTIVEQFDAATSARITASGSTLTIDPTNNLANNTQYFVTFASGTVKDVAGNNYAGITTYDFRTVAGDTTAPLVSTFSPTDGATGVAVGNNIVLTFNEAIQKGTGTIFLRSGSATGTIVEQFDAATSARITASGSTLTIDPTNNLANNTQYFVTFASGTVKDVAGNNYAGITTYDFTTVALVGQTLTGTSAVNTLLGGALNDIITGLGSTDVLDGGDGSDLYVMTSASDHLAAEINDTGASGTDEVRFTTISASTLTLFAGDLGVETVVIGTGTGTSAVTTGTTANNINASAVINALSITGNNGNNSLIGTALNDILFGNAGNDILNGGSGADIINGGKGADVLTGGTGIDTFFFVTGDSGQTATTLDKITDYTKGAVGTGDLIDFTSNLTIGGSAATATASQASINMTTGLATFAAGSGTTLSDALLDIASRMTAATNTTGEFALFRVNNSGDHYAFVSDGTAGVGANDLLIQLTGMNAYTSIDLTGGNLFIV